MKIEDSKILLAWALSTFIGWIATATGYWIPLTPGKVMAIWTVLLVTPITLTAWKFYNNISNKLFNIWASVIVLLTLENFLLTSYPVFNYFTLWMLTVAGLYYYTYTKLPPPSKQTYLYGAALNLGSTLLIYLIPLQYFSVAAAFAQAGPVFHDWYKVHR